MNFHNFEIMAPLIQPESKLYPVEVPSLPKIHPPQAQPPKCLHYFRTQSLPPEVQTSSGLHLSKSINFNGFRRIESYLWLCCIYSSDFKGKEICTHVPFFIWNPWNIKVFQLGSIVPLISVSKQKKNQVIKLSPPLDIRSFSCPCLWQFSQTNFTAALHVDTNNNLYLYANITLLYCAILNWLKGNRNRIHYGGHTVLSISYLHLEHLGKFHEMNCS